MKIQAIAIVCGAALAGCASIVGEGSSQNISVMTTPGGASCTFFREGQPLGTIGNTPGNLLVKRRKQDITIKCDKPGYEQAVFLNHSGVSSMVAANVAADIILTAGISSIIDSSTGADNEYTGNVVIGLNPVPTTAPASSPAATHVGGGLVLVRPHAPNWRAFRLQYAPLKRSGWNVRS